MDKKLKYITGSVALFLVLIILIITKCNKTENGVIDKNDSSKTSGTTNISGSGTTNISGLTNPKYNIFFENSGSMNGYVRGQTRIKNALHDLVRKIEGHNITDNIELFWLNSIVENRNNDLNHFIDNLTPQAFQSQSIGNTSETDMSKRFNLVLENSQRNEVSIMISDCLLLPATDEPISVLLPRMKSEIFHYFNNKLREKNFNTLVLQVFSDFTGHYYDFENPMDPPVQYINNKDRPYFIWVFGNEEHLAEFKDVLPKIGDIQTDLKNMHYFFLWDSEDWNYRLLPSPRIGSYSLDRNDPQSSIVRAREETKGSLRSKFQFSVGVDFAGFPLSEDYYTNPDNYEISQDYSIEIVESDNPRFSHLLKLKNQNLKEETVYIKLKNQIPKWVEDANLYDDTDINSPEQLNKTFGIKYVFLGAHEGYLTHTGYKNHYFNIEIKISK